MLKQRRIPDRKPFTSILFFLFPHLEAQCYFSRHGFGFACAKKTVPAGMAGTVSGVCRFLADNDFFRFRALTANQNLATLRIVDLQALEIVIFRFVGAGDGRNSHYSGAGGERYCKTL